MHQNLNFAHAFFEILKQTILHNIYTRGKSKSNFSEVLLLSGEGSMSLNYNLPTLMFWREAFGHCRKFEGGRVLTLARMVYGTYLFTSNSAFLRI